MNLSVSEFITNIWKCLIVYLIIRIIYFIICSSMYIHDDENKWNIVLFLSPISIIDFIGFVIFVLVEFCKLLKTHYNKEEKEIKNES